MIRPFRYDTRKGESLEISREFVPPYPIEPAVPARHGSMSSFRFTPNLQSLSPRDQSSIAMAGIMSQ